MAHLKHPEQGTEIEVPDELVKAFETDGWEGVGGASDDSNGRRKSTRKKSE